MRKKIILLSVLLSGCTHEVYDYEIKEAYTICNNSVYSLEIVFLNTLIVHCSDGKASVKKRNNAG